MTKVQQVYKIVAEYNNCIACKHISNSVAYAEFKMKPNHKTANAVLKLHREYHGELAALVSQAQANGFIEAVGFLNSVLK